MIEKMKKVAIIALKQDHETTLKTLRDLEILHVDYKREESTEFSKSLREVERLDSAIRALKEFRTKDDVEPGRFANMDWERLADETISLVGQLEEAREDVLELHREVNELAPWGDFNPDTLSGLRDKGLHVQLCRCQSGHCKDLPDGAFRMDVARIDEDDCFIIVSTEPFDSDEFPVISLPQQSMSEIRESIQAMDKKIMDLKKSLAQAATQEDTLAKALLKRTEKADFVQAGDAMTLEGELEYIQGYVPDNRKGELIQMGYRRGWGLMIDEPADDDSVPTLLRVPKWLKITRPLFEFIGISPGYKEFDVSALFLIFFTVFFGMIIGDGGYGAIFFVGALSAKFMAKGAKAKLTANLFILLSLTTIVWGFLTGNWFGMANGWANGEWSAEATKLPKVLCGIPWFLKETNIQYLCFMIAVLHLGLAHGWRTLSLFLRGKALPALGEIGWLSFVAGVFLVIVGMVAKIQVLGTEEVTIKVALYLLGGGFLLMLLFSVNWKDVGDVLNFPFGALGGFVDSLSYIRLYAVGLSGYFVAVAVNDMSSEMINAGPIGIVGGIIICLFGHVLNIALCAMGVLVHGIRLNTLEFSGHLGLEWAGIAFKPFSRRLKKN